MRSVGLGIALALGGCGYHAGSFADRTGPFPGDRVVIGCLEVAVAVVQDAAATGPVIGYGFGNRCDHVTTVDLGAVRVTGRTAEGREVALAPYDPYGELRPARLDGRKSGREAIEYQGADDVRLVCAELAGLAGLDGGAGSKVVCLDVVAGATVAAAP